MKEMKGMKVLVTAGAAGIGRAIAEAFEGVGAEIYVCDVAAPVLEACAKAMPHWKTFLCDVSSEPQVKAMFADIQAKWGALDVLVNNAGIAGPTGGVDEISVAEWDKTVAINLNGQFYCAHHAVPLLKKSKNASIVCISSVAGRLAYANRTPYAATKWAIRGLAESLAWELGEHGIRVNVLMPGIVEGPRIENVIRARAEKEGISFEDMKKKYQDMASLRRMVTAEDVANQAVYLCSEMGRNLSGQSISVDGHVRAL